MKSHWLWDILDFAAKNIYYLWEGGKEGRREGGREGRKEDAGDDTSSPPCSESTMRPPTHPHTFSLQNLGPVLRG